VGTMAKIDDSVKKKVPELRFKGFTDILLANMAILKLQFGHTRR